MSETEENPLDALMRKIEEATAQLEPLNAKREETNREKLEIDNEYREQVARVTAKQMEIETARFEIQKAINEARAEAQRLREEEERARELARLEAEANKAENDKLMAELALIERFEQATLTSPWRELAKDHQIQAGHKIVTNRNVILADPMGLGKTLSAIITCDMAERVTKDATPEFPFLGEERQVWVPAKWVWTRLGENADIGYRGKKAVEGEEIGYLDYDTKVRYLREYYIEELPAHYETRIVGGIERPVGRKILYVCPSSLLRNVLKEWRLWSPHRNATYIGGMTKAERNYLIDTVLPELDDYVIIINYEAWRRDKALLTKLSDIGFDTIIIDEAHNVKDRKTSAYKGIETILNNARPEYVIPMTGTPILNRPQELFTLLHMVNPSEFYAENDFLYTYCQQDEDAFWSFQPGGLDRIAKRITNNFLRRTKDQAGIKLPPKTIINHDLEVDEEAYPLQAKARKQMRDFATIIIDEAKGKALSATVKIALITRLRQIETWPAGIVQRDKLTKEIILQLEVEESQKVDYVIRQNLDDKQWDGLIPEAIEDERIVLFSQFKAPLREIERRVNLSGKRAIVLDGDTSQAVREEILTDFDIRTTPDRSTSKWDIVLCNYKVGGVGLNLTAATQLIILDEEWNPGKRDQAYDRIHRIGQEKPVTIHLVRNQATIDDFMADIMARKENVVEGFNAVTTNDIDINDILDGYDK